MVLNFKHRQLSLVIVLYATLVDSMYNSRHLIARKFQESRLEFVSRSNLNVTESEFNNLKDLVYLYKGHEKFYYYNLKVQSIIDKFEKSAKKYKTNNNATGIIFNKISIDTFSDYAYECDKFIFSGNGCKMLHYFCSINCLTYLYKPKLNHSDFIILSEILKIYITHRKKALDLYFEKSLKKALDFLSPDDKKLKRIIDLSLHVRFIKYFSHEIFKRFTNLKTLRLLFLPNNADIALISKLPSLEILILEKISLSEKQVCAIQMCEKIKSLTINSCSLIDMIKFDRMCQLSSLKILYCKLYNQTLLNISASKMINHLYLHCCTTDSVHSESWSKIYDMNLTKLSIKKFDSAYLHLIKLIRKFCQEKTSYDSNYYLKNIEELKLEHLYATNDELTLLLTNICPLKILSLRQCPLIRINKDFCDSVEQQLKLIESLNLA